jgi:hypothetical protein
MDFRVDIQDQLIAVAHSRVVDVVSIDVPLILAILAGATCLLLMILFVRRTLNRRNQSRRDA